MSDDETRELPPVAPADQGQDQDQGQEQGQGPVDREPGTTTAGDADTAAQGAAVERPTTEPTTTELRADVPTTELPADQPTTELPRAEPPADRPTTELPPVQPARTPPAAPAADAYAASSGHIRVTTPSAPQPAPRTTPRVGTVVWGLVVAAVGVGLLSIAWGAHLDTELAFIVLLGAAGVALLVGSLAGMRRSRNRMEGRD